MVEQIQEVAPPTQPEPVTTVPAQLPKKNNLLTIVIPACRQAGCLIVILLVGIGGVYAGIQIGKKQVMMKPSPVIPTIIPTQVLEPTTIPTQVPETTNIPTPDDTTNWKTYTNSDLTFRYPSTWDASKTLPSRIEGSNLSVTIDVVDKNSTLMNECMQITSTNTNNGVVVKKFSRVTTGEMCSTNDGTPREIWIVPRQDAYTPGISFRYSSVDEANATKIFGQILSTFKFTSKE